MDTTLPPTAIGREAGITGATNIVATNVKLHGAALMRRPTAWQRA
jgi:hypothetical protein